MPYTIRLAEKYNFFCAEKLITVLEKRVERDTRFSLSIRGPISSFQGLPRRSTKPRFGLELLRVRLTQGKEYCGQHPGECVGPVRRKPVNRLLEWDDWVAFNDLINDILDAANLETDVWSKPRDLLDHGHRFWIRKDNQRRTAWDWVERQGSWAPLRIWNHGSPDQFA